MASIPFVVHVFRTDRLGDRPIGRHPSQLLGRLEAETAAPRPLLSASAQLAAQSARAQPPHRSHSAAEVAVRTQRKLILE